MSLSELPLEVEAPRISSRSGIARGRGRRAPLSTRRTSLILNFTANTYHWGCYGTSTEIYTTLAERGYLVNWLDVRTTHAIKTRPTQWADFASAEFARRFWEANGSLQHLLSEADFVVVNGEGTLHRFHAAPANLLYLMYAAREQFGKPVHLINHSFLPSGGDASDANIDPIYQSVARSLATVVPRETSSAAVLRRLGIPHLQGFDCLPRFIRRHNVERRSDPQGPVLLSGGVNLSCEVAKKIAAAVGRTLPTGRAVRFLAGAKAFPAAEDEVIYGWMREQLPTLEWYSASSIEDWLHQIAEAACVVSGRFHHTIAAATLQTPSVVFPSNTSKVPAMCSMFGLPAPIPFDAADLPQRVQAGLCSALDGSGAVATTEAIDRVVALAQNNFAGL